MSVYQLAFGSAAGNRNPVMGLNKIKVSFLLHKRSQEVDLVTPRSSET